jgi:hypothetical protein
VYQYGCQQRACLQSCPRTIEKNEEQQAGSDDQPRDQHPQRQGHVDMEQNEDSERDEQIIESPPCNGFEQGDDQCDVYSDQQRLRPALFRE